jgi:predicted SAM-dependent methyltransferase
MALIRINLGCGNRLRGKGWIEHDLYRHRPEVAVTHDLNVRPWPWADNSACEIDATSLFEHLTLTLIESLDECWRILAPNGILHLKYPLHTGPFTHDDPTHRWFWSEKAVDYVDVRTKYGQEHPYYTKRKWTIKGRNTSARNFWAQMTPVKT